MCMMSSELDTKVKDLQELRRMREELDLEISGIEDALKEHMKETNVFEINALTGHITWFEQKSVRLDSAAIKKELPDLWKRYSRENTSRYFRICK